MSSVSSTTSLLSASTATSTTSTASTSDIDWDALIEAAVAAKTAKADSIDVKITENETTIAAYEELQSLLQAVLVAANMLRAPSGTLDSQDDVFLSRSAYFNANGDVDASASIGATVESGAVTGDYDLTVTQLAAAHKVIGASQASNADDLGYAGVVSIGTQGGSTLDITVTEDMSLADLAEAINNESDATGVQATVLQVASGDYRLVLSTVETGQQIAVSAASGDDVLNALGITDADGAFANVLQDAQDAIFTIDGVEITRSTNEIDDVLDGVTLYLYQTTPQDISITLEIGTDVSTVKDAIVALVDAYNAFREFAYTQQQVVTTNADGETEASVLFGDSTMRNVSAAVTSALNTIIDDESMALLGLSFDDSNYLEVDEDVLDDALLTNLEDIEALLTFSMSSSSSKLLLLARGTEVPDDFTLDIAVDADGNITSAAVGGDTSLFTISGSTIAGAEGTAYEGFKFVFTGKASTSVDFSFSSGIAEQLHNIASRATDATSGTLTTLVADLEAVNEDLAEKSDDIREKAETYETNLANRYAQYQAAIETAESSLEYLTTLIDTWNSD